jgi:hypothetical protein
VAENYDALELCYQAVHSSHGIAVEVSSMNTALAHLYKARKESGDQELEVLQFRRSPYRPEQEIWITKGLTKSKLLEQKSKEKTQSESQL